MALVLALLLLTGWGQVHRVLHPGASVAGMATAAGPQAGKLPLGGHEEGGSLCQLLDHLSQGSAAVPVLFAPPILPVLPVHAAWPVRTWPLGAPAAFEARGPPTLT